MYLTYKDFPETEQRDWDALVGGNDLIFEDIEVKEIAHMKGALGVRYDADALFDADNRYDVIVKYLAVYVLYGLYKRISPDHVPAYVKEDKVSADLWLDKVASGDYNYSFPSLSEEQNHPLRYGNSRTKQIHHY